MLDTPTTAFVSAGGAGWLNLWLARACHARSIIVMNPGREDILQSVDLAVVSRDAQAPLGRSNIIFLEGSPTLIHPGRMAECALQFGLESGPSRDFRVGLLLGGDDYAYQLREQTVDHILDQLDEILDARDGELLVTTSQRTSAAVERLLKSRLANHRRCRLLVIANEANRPGTVEAILGSSDVAVVSPESVSMICEAASSSARVVVFEEVDQPATHPSFLQRFRDRGYIDVTPVSGLAATIAQPGSSQRVLDDRQTLRQALEALL